MYRKSSNGRLDEALAVLISNQSSFISNQSGFLAQLAQLSARTDERFARIEAELADIKAILLRHEHILQSLPEAVRDKIGFRAP